MKNILKLSIGLILLVALTSCNEEDQETNSPAEKPAAAAPVKVQFEEDLHIQESSEADTIKILFDKPASTNGSLVLEVVTDFPEAFETNLEIDDDLIEIPVKKGDEYVYFTIIAIDDQLSGDDKTVGFEIIDVADGFEISTKKQMTVTIDGTEAPITVDFLSISASIMESDDQGIVIYVQLSAPAPAANVISIDVSGDYESAISSSPGINQNGDFIIHISAGQSSFDIEVLPIDNSWINDNREITFTLTGVTDPLLLGSQLTFELTIINDDETSPTPRAKSYTTTGGGWMSKKTYEYDEADRISKVHWETATPNTRTGTDTYYYDENGQLVRINHFENHDEYFYWENDKVIRSESIENEVKREYKEYQYDAVGNLATQKTYHRQASGAYLESFLFVYLYFTDGNLYKQLTFAPVQDMLNPYTLLSTRSYEGYMEKENLFPIEIIPTIAAQTKLPTSYRLEESGANLLYNFSYEFDDQDHLIRRRAYGAGTDITEYSYY